MGLGDPYINIAGLGPRSTIAGSDIIHIRSTGGVDSKMAITDLFNAVPVNVKLTAGGYISSTVKNSAIYFAGGDSNIDGGVITCFGSASGLGSAVRVLRGSTVTALFTSSGRILFGTNPIDNTIDTLQVGGTINATDNQASLSTHSFINETIGSNFSAGVRVHIGDEVINTASLVLRQSGDGAKHHSYIEHRDTSSSNLYLNNANVVGDIVLQLNSTDVAIFSGAGVTFNESLTFAGSGGIRRTTGVDQTVILDFDCPDVILNTAQYRHGRFTSVTSGTHGSLWYNGTFLAMQLDHKTGALNVVGALTVQDDLIQTAGSIILLNGAVDDTLNDFQMEGSGIFSGALTSLSLSSTYGRLIAGSSYGTNGGLIWIDLDSTLSSAPEGVEIMASGTFTNVSGQVYISSVTKLGAGYRLKGRSETGLIVFTTVTSGDTTSITAGFSW